MIRCDTRPARWSDLAKALLPRRGPELWNDPSSVPVHSGKAALNHVFSYLRAAKILEDKNSKILTPPWLGYWVYNAMRPHGSPVLHDDPEIKAAVVYHQYGFPQDLDEIKDACSRRGLAFIEDCAHALGGTYKGRPLGGDGLAGIFSLSKFYPSLIGGAVRSGDAALRAHVAGLENSGSRALGLFSLAAKLASQKTDSATSVAHRVNEAAYAGYPYSRRLPWSGKICSLPGISDELDLRRRRYALYRKLLPNYDELQRLEPDAVPYVLPLIHPKKETLDRMAAALRALDVGTGVYQFDANRNLFNARYVACLWLPVHGGVAEEDVERIVAAVKREL
jgi:dTDP-4-amino-4,6-dideoxygalactose transaminase